MLQHSEFALQQESADSRHEKCATKHSGRRGKAKVCDFQELRNGIEHPQKRVKVYYVDAGNALFAVTVYVFCGKWEAK